MWGKRFEYMISQKKRRKSSREVGGKVVRIYHHFTSNVKEHKKGVNGL